VDNDPQTTVVWRTYLPITPGSEAELDRLGEAAVAGYFEAAPPHAAEQLETDSYQVAEWLIARAKKLAKFAESNQRRQTETQSPESSAPRPRKQIAVLLTAAGDFVQAYRLPELARAQKQRLTRELAGKILIVQSTVAGLESTGTLDAKLDEPPAWVADKEETFRSDTDGTEVPVIPWRVLRWEGSDDEAEPQLGNNWQRRHQFVLSRDADGEIRSRLAVYQWRQASATEDDRALGYEQTLADHRSCAQERARRIAVRLGLSPSAADVLTVAARLHDEGKQAERWQAAFHAPKGAVYAKTKGPIDQQLLDGYRHEFGSLFHAELDPVFQTLELDQQDLVLHLIAAHHGQARPSISVRGCEYGPPSQLAQRAGEVALRFARLQRRWGPWGLAWWEALLRAADQQASKDAAKGAC
jgi:CRISPR-associated endonuclease/helicase Cas3